MTETARIMLVDDHPFVRDGLRARLALMDVGMAGTSGIQLAAIFHERFPAIRVLMLSMHDNVEYVTQAVHAGASGYVLKDSPSTEIAYAIDAVLAGKTFFSTGLAARVIQAQSMQTPLERLTPHELDILDALAQGLPSKQIAQQHSLSARTVETHRLNMKRKLDIDDQAELIKFAVRAPARVKHAWKERQPAERALCSDRYLISASTPPFCNWPANCC